MLQHHGITEVILNGNIIEVELIGGFDELGMRASVDKVIENITLLKDQPFCLLISLTRLIGCTPEGYLELERIDQYLDQAPYFVCKALLATSQLMIQIAQVWVPNAEKQPVHLFSEREKAIVWLNDQIDAWRTSKEN